MKSYDSFGFDFDYQGYLYRQARKDHLPDTNVADPAREAMLAQLLASPDENDIFLEIGPASNPYVVGSSRSNIHYVGIDGGKSEYWYDPLGRKSGLAQRNRDNSDMYMDAAVRSVADNPKATIIWGDAQHLPFADASKNPRPIRETFMRDVLLETGLHPRSVEQVFREQARVLAANGLVIVRETSFASYYDPAGRGRNLKLLSLFASMQRAGFNRRLTLFDTDSEYHQLLRQYPGSEDNQVMPGGYYVIAQQGENPLALSKQNWWNRFIRKTGSLASR